MASTPEILESINDLDKGQGYERQRVVWDLGTTTGTVIPSETCKIRKILKYGVANLTTANGVQVVRSYSPSEDKDILTLTGTANDSFEVWVVGRPA